MKNRQRAKLDSYQRITDFNSKNAANLATIQEYALERQTFDTNVEAIKNGGVVQVTSSVPLSDTAADLKEKMVQLVYSFILRGSVKAKQAGDITLGEQLGRTLSYIRSTTKTESISRSKSLRDLLNDNLGILTNISITDISNINQAITAYDSAKDKPVETRQQKKASGTDILPTAFAAADEAVDNMHSLIRSYFITDNPVLVDEFELAMNVIDTGIRHTSCNITVMADESGNALPGITLTDTSNGKTYISDDEGMIHIATHKSGHFNFTITATGRQTVSLGVDIKRGTQNDFSVRLKLG